MHRCRRGTDRLSRQGFLLVKICRLAVVGTWQWHHSPKDSARHLAMFVDQQGEGWANLEERLPPREMKMPYDNPFQCISSRSDEKGNESEVVMHSRKRITKRSHTICIPSNVLE